MAATPDTATRETSTTERFERLEEIKEELAVMSLQSSTDWLYAPKYSDLIIKCQGMEWKVHRIILSNRCDFFRACIDDFKVFP